MRPVQPVLLDDVLGRERYGTQRDAIRRRVVAHKRARRVPVGDHVTFVFEDRVSVWYQTQEMTWVEQIADLDGIRAELGVYNQLLPTPDELSCTMLVEITDQARIRDELARLIGIDRHVHLRLGDRLVPGVFEEGRQTDAKLSAVQYVRFPIGAAGRAAIVAGAPVALVIDHPAYRAETALPEATRAALAAELADAAVADAALRRVRDGA